MKVIKKNLKEAQYRKKSYVDHNTFLKEFQAGEHAYLLIKLKKSSLQIGSWFKLTPQFFGHLRIIERIGPLSYQLALPPIVKFHDVFHVPFPKKYVKDDDHVIDWCILQVDPDGEF